MAPGWRRLSQHLTLLLLLLLSTLHPASSGPRYSSRIVDTQSGAIRGIILEPNSERLEPVEGFLGVRYGEGGRFRVSMSPAPRWKGTKLADTYPPVCPQALPDISNKTAALQSMPIHRYHFLKKLAPHLANQSEDCLYLNIYVPGSGARGLEAPYAVMVYLHGESFEWNSGNHYDGRVLASYGHVIFITVNYRLGLLGFLKMGTTAGSKDLPFGAGDVVSALKWIKSNIKSFGGDPTRVTLIGHDTGAVIANILLISPLSKGLFTGVCLLSGSLLSPWAVIQDPATLKEKVGAELGCPPGPQLDGCLHRAPLISLLKIKFSPPRFLPAVGPWPPRGDATAAVEQAGEPFLSSKLMLGTTSTESFLDLSNHEIQYGIEEDQRNRILRTYVRNAFVYHLNEIFSAVRNEYTDWEKPIQHPINIRDSTLEALSDGHTVAPLLRLAYLHSRRGAPTWFLHFNYQSKESDYPQRLGSVRGEDVNYLLGLPLVGGHPFFFQNYTSQDVRVAESVLNLFTNFAKTGDPNEPRRLEGHVTATTTQKDSKGRHKGFNWDLYEPTTQLYLSLSAKPRMKSHYRGHKMAVWLNLIPQLHQPGEQDVSMRHHHFHERANHFYAGTIRAESFTRVPPIVTTAGELIECPPNVTASDRPAMGLSEPDLEEDEATLLTRHYYSTSTALGVTVGVGCLLLLLNALIFSAIYYQRRKKKKKKRKPEEPDELEQQLPPSCLKTADRLKKVPPTPPARTSSNPIPLATTPTSGVAPGTGTIKKRVQIQEISV